MSKAEPEWRQMHNGKVAHAIIRHPLSSDYVWSACGLMAGMNQSRNAVLRKCKSCARALQRRSEND